MKRLLYIPIIIWHSAWSGWRWPFKRLIERVTGKDVIDDLDTQRQKDFYGWLSPSLATHWRRAFDERDAHSWKNVGSEWADQINRLTGKTDGQRVFKFMSILIVLSWLLAAASATATLIIIAL